MSEKVKATFLVPCLNEARTLGALLQEAKAVLSNDPVADWELLVADNGSTDGSPDIARENGARVLPVPVRGYGAALRAGILGSSTEWVVYGDADMTYRPADAPTLLSLALREKADMVLGSRIDGKIEPGAMPWMHRYVGTPVLSWIISRLYGIHVSDCNSGIRCLRKEAFLDWKVESPGMEFASELLIRSALSKARILEAPATLRTAPPDRVPHLRRWQDGMRHLLVALAGAPWLFWRSGLFFMAASFALAIPCGWGPFPVLGAFSFFGLHTLALSIVMGFYGALLTNLGLWAYSTSGRVRLPRVAAFLIHLKESSLFWSLVGFASAFLLGCAYLIWEWSRGGLMQLDHVMFTLWLVYIAIIPSTLVMGVFQVHLKKRFTG